MEPGVRKGKRSLLASHTCCKCSMETTHNSVKVNLGIKVMKLVESLIGREVTVGQGSECHLTFVRGLLHTQTKRDGVINPQNLHHFEGSSNVSLKIILVKYVNDHHVRDPLTLDWNYPILY